MTVIDPARKPVTLVVTMTVNPDEIDEKIEHLIKSGKEHVGRPGFISAALHRSADGTRILEYIQWETMGHLNDMLQSYPNGNPHSPDFALSFDGMFYDVAAVTE